MCEWVGVSHILYYLKFHLFATINSKSTIKRLILVPYILESHSLFLLHDLRSPLSSLMARSTASHQFLAFFLNSIYTLTRLEIDFTDTNNILKR